MRRAILLPFGVLYAIFAALNLRMDSFGIMDNIVSIAVLVSVFLLAPWARFAPWELVLANLPLLMHNVGTLGEGRLYSLVFVIGFDAYLHLLASGVAAFLLARLLARKGVPSFGLFASGVALLLGVLVELMEYAGSLVFPPSQGIFYPTLVPSERYSDTIKDLFADVLGIVIGACVGAASVRKKRKGRAPLAG